MTDVAVGTVTGRRGAAVPAEAGGGELDALEMGRSGTESGALGSVMLGTESCTLGTVMFGAETCTLGTEPDMLGTETCTLGTVPDAETGTVGVETWGAVPPVWTWGGVGAEEDGDVDGRAELGVGAAVPDEAAGPGDTAVAPAAECGAALDVAGATAAAPDMLEAAAATDGVGTAGSATPPALAAVLTAR